MRPRITLIAAMTENRVIGRDNAIPWHIPADLARFKTLTTGHHLIMGRKTFESIGHPLPGRRTVILTRQPGYRAEGCQVAASLSEALELAKTDDELFICGGEAVYRQALPLADRVLLTVIRGELSGDAFFPQLPPAFTEVSREPLPDPHFVCDFIVYEKQSR